MYSEDPLVKAYVHFFAVVSQVAEAVVLVADPY